MQIYAQHLHSSFSMASRQDREAYVRAAKAAGDECFVTTEHLDLEACFWQKDVIPDFAAQQAELRRLQEAYGIETLFGVEAGYRPVFEDRLRAILAAHPFDVVLLRVHEDEGFECMAPAVLRGRTVEEMYADYLDRMIQAADRMEDFDVMTHVDYALRVNGGVELDRFEGQMKTLFSLLAEKDKALEMNTRTVGALGMGYLERYARWFLECGGKRFSLGSDGHRLSAHKAHFEAVCAMLREVGAEGLTFYKKRQPLLLPL